MENVHFVPYAFQPIFDTKAADKVMGYEALIRPVGKSAIDYIRERTKEGTLEALEFETFVNAIKRLATLFLTKNDS